MDVAGELMADQRDLLSHRVERLMAQRRVAGGDQAEDGHQDQQQRNKETKPEWARLAASTPPLSSPYFLMIPNTNADAL